ncbi:MAG: mechanosensitive ion channel family protein [Pontiellaceae bacterium]|jgi:MscS family membrane protein|nr:mechanosensitive ion channel family protein [Pontiellaceae bacterium]
METTSGITIVKQAVEKNDPSNYLEFLLLVLAGFIAGRVLKYFCEQAVKKTPLGQSSFHRAALELSARTVTFPMAVIGVCLGFQMLVENELYRDVTAVLVTIAVTYVLYQMVELLSHWMSRLTAKTETTLDDMVVPLVRKTLRVVIVIFGLVQIAQQLSDKPITSILTGLGVGGLAVALAAQDTIKNFFGSLVIFADHPFLLGDRIIVEGEDGTVEEVGMRSTRIRTLDGHLVTIPNGELANKLIRNVASRPFIKRVATIGLTYDTPPGKVERAIEIIKEELTRQSEKLHPDNPPRVFFTEFGSVSLNIQVIYWFAPPEYWSFLEFDQMFKLGVLRRFNEEKIEIAFPTQTVFLAGDPKRPLFMNPPV